MKRALTTGITGQDGAYLVELRTPPGERIDRNGVFIGNHHYPIAVAIEVLATL